MFYLLRIYKNSYMCILMKKKMKQIPALESTRIRVDPRSAVTDDRRRR